MQRRAKAQAELFSDLPVMQPPQSAMLQAAIARPAEPPVPANADDAETEANRWYRRLRDVLDGVVPSDAYLPAAERALAARPGDPDILLLGVVAALLDGEHKRATVYLKRFSKKATSPGEPLLRAIALNLAGQRLAAKLVLERHRLTTIYEAVRILPIGRTQLGWLFRHYNEIMGNPAPGCEGRGKGRVAAPTSAAQRKSQAQPKSAAKRPPESAKSADKSAARPASKVAVSGEALPAAVAVAAPAASPSLPLVDIDISFRLETSLAPLTTALSGRAETDGRAFLLRERWAHLGLAQDFDELLCLPHLTGVDPLWHQIETVRKVLKQFRGRVLLADEVGLGKTIEAGMVLKEYALRGMAERALVLTPASLVGQWREELECKFGLAFATTYDALLRTDPAAFWQQPRIVASIATARRQEHAEILAERQLDLVVVDEAHHLRERASAGWRLVDRLNKRFLLLLSATPVQNDLIELYNLLTLLKPGIFKTLKEFRAAHMTPGQPRQPVDPDGLRQLMRGAMVRNTRAVVALKLPRRHASTIKVEPAPGEAEAYAALAEAARSLAAGGEGPQRLILHHLLAAAGSSPAAAARMCERMAERPEGANARVWRGLAERLGAIPHGGKEAVLLELLTRNPLEKKLVFVQARETLELLATRLEAEGLALARFDGSMTGPEKDAAIAAFRDTATVLLCTQSGGEGRNIQFCNTLINFDVPWNPMAIEQRIGRIDRIGQQREVFVFNLVTAGTVEEQVLGLLEEKISMFELVVGEVGAILGNVEEDREFPDLVLEAWLETSEADRAAAFAALGEKLDAARRQHDGAKALDERLFGEDFETA